MIDAAIDRLVAAYRAAGLPRIQPAPRGVSRTLAEIADAIRPLRLPADVETFWRRVDPLSVTVAPFPHPMRPDDALSTWRTHTEQVVAMPPRSLFPVCNEGHLFLLVELATDEWGGGVCFDWGYAGSPYTIRHAGLAGYVDLLATMVELGDRTFDEREWEQTCAVRLTAAQPLGPYGDQREWDEDVRSWPEHWRRASSLTPEVRQPRGATATVAELLARAASGGEARGTIRGRVHRVFGSAAGARVTVVDATADLDLWCPAALSAYGPVLGREFEFDVVVRRATPPPNIDREYHEVTRRGMAYDLAGAQEAYLDLYATMNATPPSAEATAIRPLD